MRGRLCKRGLWCINPGVVPENARRGERKCQMYKCVPCKTKIQTQPFLPEAVEECRCGSAFPARVRPPPQTHQPSPDIFMWVTSRTPEGLLPEGGGDSEGSFSPKGESGGWSQTGLKIAANYQHMCFLAETSQIYRLLFASSAGSQVTAVLFSLMKTSESERAKGGAQTSKSIYCVVVFF